MPNLFPLDDSTDTNNSVSLQPVTNQPVTNREYGKSVVFDFDKGEFVSLNGQLTEISGAKAWLEWCRKALYTERFKYYIYSDLYGEEFSTLIPQYLTREANESEIRRIAIETLMVNPYTKEVSNFDFDWEDDKCYFTCDVTNILDESVNLDGEVVIRGGD